MAGRLFARENRIYDPNVGFTISCRSRFGVIKVNEKAMLKVKFFSRSAVLTHSPMISETVQMKGSLK